MDSEEYFQALVQMLELDGNLPKLSLPFDLEPGQDPGDAIVKYLIQENILIQEGDLVFLDREKAAALDPNLVVFFDLLQQAEIKEAMDGLEELGLIYSTVSDNGEIGYAVTEAGAAFIDENNVF